MSGLSLVSFLLCLLFCSLKPQALTQEKIIFGLDKSQFSDSEYEDYMHRIYLQNYSKPLETEKWEEILNQVSVDVYKLQFKDNLWDLSRQFFKNSLLWSKLWGMNSQIANPHRLLPEDIIDLTLSGLSSGGTDNKNWFSKDPLFRTKVKTLTSEEIPSSIPPLNFNVPKDFFNVSGLTFSGINKQAPLPYYLREEELSGQGEVIGKESDRQYSFNGEDVIVRIDSAPSLGIYTVFKNLGPFEKSLFNLLNVTGYEVAVKGTIEVLGFLHNTENLYRARVIDSIGSIERGDIILAGPPQLYNLSQKGPVGVEMEGTIIGVPRGYKETMLGLYSFVYLNKGLAENVQVGDVYYIRKGERRIKHSVGYDKPVVGKLKIAHANSEASTAIIIGVKEPVFVGDGFNHLPDMFSDLAQSEFIEEVEEEGGMEAIDEDGEGKMEGKEEIERIEEEMDEIDRESVEEERLDEMEEDDIEEEELDEADEEEWEEEDGIEEEGLDEMEEDDIEGEELDEADEEEWEEEDDIEGEELDEADEEEWEEEDDIEEEELDEADEEEWEEEDDIEEEELDEADEEEWEEEDDIEEEELDEADEEE